MFTRAKAAIGLGALALLASACVFDGTWTATSPAPVQGPVGARNPTFSDVSCLADDWCMAVGDATSPAPATYPILPQVQLWDGVGWSPAATPITGANGGYPRDVACASNERCVVYVVGIAESFQRWDGAAWHVVGSLVDVGNDPALACAPDGSCTIADGGEKTWTVLADGSSTAVDNDGAFITDLSCWAAGDCIGFNQFLGRAYQWDGSSWTQTAMGFPLTGTWPAYQQANEVTCASPTSCMAVGTERNGPAGTPNEAWSMHWDGTTWTELPVPVASTLWHVSCPTAGECIADGRPSADPEGVAILAWNGTSWFEAPVPASGLRVFGIDCVPLRCMVVGNTGPVGAKVLAAERYDWTNP